MRSMERAKDRRYSLCSSSFQCKIYGLVSYMRSSSCDSHQIFRDFVLWCSLNNPVVLKFFWSHLAEKNAKHSQNLLKISRLDNNFKTVKDNSNPKQIRTMGIVSLHFWQISLWMVWGQLRSICPILVRKSATSCHILARPITSCHAMSRHVTSCHVKPRHVTSCQITSCNVTSCHVMSRHAMSRPVTSCHVI